MAATDLTVYKGDDKTYTLTFVDADSVAIDITGYTVFFTVKINKTDDDADAVISKTVTSHSDPTNGITTVTLTNVETDITAKRYHYDIQIKDTSNLITTVVVGTFILAQDVTRRTS